MSIEIRQLRFAVMTADKRSFARAADALGTKQSSLSKKVADLEIRLGVKLFDRTTNGATPTEASKNVLEAARRIVTDVDNLVTTARAMSYGDQGRLAIGFSSSLTGGNLRAAIAEYLVRFPDVQFDALETESERLRNASHLRMLDAAISAADISEPGINKVPLWPERVMVVLPGGHVLAESEQVYWSDLKREVIVMPRDGTGANLAAMLTAKLTSQNLRPSLITQEASHDTIVNMVSVGRFITIVTEAMQGVNWPGIVFKDVHDPTGQAYLDFSLFWRADNENAALKHFFKLLKERYSALAVD
jgi:DNA-binding transcriptional LysR family regulator